MIVIAKSRSASLCFWFVVLLAVSQIFVALAAKKIKDDDGNEWLNDLRGVPKPKYDASGKYKTFSKRFIRSDISTGEYTHLSYNLTLLENQYVNLDDPRLEVINVTCAGARMDIETATLKGASELGSDLQNSPTGLLYGDTKWGCLPATGEPGGRSHPADGHTKEPSPIYRSFWLEGWNSSQNDLNPMYKDTKQYFVNKTSITITTKIAPWYAFFGKAQVVFFSNHSSVLGLKPSEKARRVPPADIHETTRNSASSANFIPLATLNYNFDERSRTAVQDDIPLYRDGTTRVSCVDCYMYAQAGVGFEFETVPYLSPIYTTNLVYAKAWVGGSFAASATFRTEVSMASCLYHHTAIPLSKESSQISRRVSS
jgi:hypothetical protein